MLTKFDQDLCMNHSTLGAVVPFAMFFRRLILFIRSRRSQNMGRRKRRRWRLTTWTQMISRRMFWRTLSSLWASRLTFSQMRFWICKCQTKIDKEGGWSRPQPLRWGKARRTGWLNSCWRWCRILCEFPFELEAGNSQNATQTCPTKTRKNWYWWC